MKKNILLLLFAFILFGCSTNIKYISITKDQWSNATESQKEFYKIIDGMTENEYKKFINSEHQETLVNDGGYECIATYIYNEDGTKKYLYGQGLGCNIIQYDHTYSTTENYSDVPSGIPYGDEGLVDQEIIKELYDQAIKEKYPS